MSNTKGHQDLAERIERLVQEHIETTRTAAQQAVERAFAGTGPSPRRAPHSSKSTSDTRKRRASSEVAALGERLYKAVCATPGAPMTVLSREVSASARELHRPMSLLKRSGRVRSVGERHATRYFPRTSGTAASV